MAGHSKWSKIKRSKGAQDVQKAKIFTKMTREIIVATQQGGSDPSSNVRLRMALQQAKVANLPKITIQRALKKASNTAEDAGNTLRSYEGYGPHGVAVLVEAITENNNRTVANVRSHFKKHGGNLDKRGVIQHLFDHKGLFVVKKDAVESWDKITLALVDAGVDDMKKEEGHMLFTCTPTDRGAVQKVFEAVNIVPEEATVTFLPRITITLDDCAASKMEVFINQLEELEDVQAVYHNWKEV